MFWSFKKFSFFLLILTDCFMKYACKNGVFPEQRIVKRNSRIWISTNIQTNLSSRNTFCLFSRFRILYSIFFLYILFILNKMQKPINTELICISLWNIFIYLDFKSTIDTILIILNKGIDKKLIFNMLKLFNVIPKLIQNLVQSFEIIETI